MNDVQITEQSLQLYLDGELDPMSAELLEQRLEQDASLREKLKQLREMQQMLQFAYADENLPAAEQIASQQSVAPRRFSQWSSGLAASVMLSLGLTLGWFANNVYQLQDQPVYTAGEQKVSLWPRVPSQLAALDEPRKFMIHMNAFDQKATDKTFLETATLLASYANSGLPVKLDVMIDQQGVQLFDEKNNQQLKRLRELINDHDNIDFYACSESLKLFMEGIRMPDDFSTIHTDRVVEEIIPERMEDGWVYLKV